MKENDLLDMKLTNNERRKILIRHVLSDGRVLNNIEGFRVPCTQATESAYRILAGFLKINGKTGQDEQKTNYAMRPKALAEGRAVAVPHI